MQAMLIRRGNSGQISQQKYFLTPPLKDFEITINSIKAPVLKVHPYRAEFTAKSKIIIDNIFQEHTARCCLLGFAKTNILTYLAPIASIPINTTELISFTILITFALYLFKHAEHKRSQNENSKILIDVTASNND